MGFDEITQKVIVKGKKEAWGLSSGASQHVGVRRAGRASKESWQGK